MLGNWNKKVQGTNMEMTTIKDCIAEYYQGNIIVIDGDKRRLDIIIDGVELTSEQVEEQRLANISRHEAFVNQVNENFNPNSALYKRLLNN